MVGNMQFVSVLSTQASSTDHITPSNPYERFMISIIDRLERIESRVDALGKGMQAVASNTKEHGFLYIKTGAVDPSAYPLVHQAVGDCFVGKNSIQAFKGWELLQNIEAVIKGLGKTGVQVESISVRSRLEVDASYAFISDRAYMLTTPPQQTARC